MLAADVNAVVDGLFAGGATEVVIADGHGSGNPDPDLRTDLLDARATQIIRDEPFDTYFDLPESEEVDAVAVVGMHSKTGSGGFAAHTFTLGIDLLINGQAITETELVALSWGRVGVPVIFASGDDKLRGDLETMPWIEYVTVKDAPSADTAIPRPVEEARADLREGARRAVERLAEAKSLRVSIPVRASLHAVPPARPALPRGHPGAGTRRRFRAVPAGPRRRIHVHALPDRPRLRRRHVQLYRHGHARSLRRPGGGGGHGPRRLPEPAAGGGRGPRPTADEIMAAFTDALWQRWHDQESGRYERPGADEAIGEMIRRFHGYR